jgi:class 3 adenylate cyclase
MACGGLKFLEKDIKTKNKNYTERVLDLALDMMRCVETNTFDMGVKLTLKIGVHHGNCTYGVIGYHKPQFSLMGDTVNTTSRHCTTGDPGCIVLSFAAQARINHSKYPNLQKKSVSMKGKGALDVYMLNKDAIQKINNPTFFGEHVVNNPLNNIIEPGKHPLSKESPSSELAGKRQVQNRRGTDGNKPGFFSPMGQSGSLSNPFAIQPIAVNNDSLHHSVLRNQTQNKTEPPKEPIPQLVTESDGDFTDRALNNTNRGPLSQPDQLHSLKSRNPLDLELTPTNAMKQASSPNFVKSDEDILRNVKRAATFAHSESKAESLADASIEELQDSESDNEMELKNEQTEKITNIMKSCAGYLYGFRKEKFSLEKFYNKQMRIKYKWKVKKTLVVITAMIFVQEVLLWISFTLGEGVDQVRIGFFAWVFLSFIYLMLSSKVYKPIVLMLIFTKTALCILDLTLVHVKSSIKQERKDLSYYTILFTSLIDSLIFISIGIYPVTELFILNAISLVSVSVVTVAFRSEDPALLSILLSILYFYVFNFIDIINHFDTEITAFFNYIKIEQRGYYLNTFVDRLLPKHIKGVSNCGTEVYENVTLLFADIVGYTEYSAGKNPRQVVDLLSQLFTSFDKECNKLNLYKLYTIGDCYVVMSFLDKYNRKTPKEEANDVVQLAMFMISTIFKVRTKINFEKLNMRIGIHTGTVFGGVIGTDIVRFDLYGPDVLTANKMESGGEPGRINLSEVTKYLLDELETTNYTFEPHKEIEIKSLNRKYQSFFLNFQEDKMV